MRKQGRYYAAQAKGNRTDWLVFKRAILPGNPPQRIRWRVDVVAHDGSPREQRTEVMGRVLAEARAAALNRRDASLPLEEQT